MFAIDTPESLIPRYLTQRVQTALQDTPVVLINGPRQCGKTTLVRDLLDDERDYLSLDDETILAGARSDPVGLIRRLDRAAIDEIQRAPELLRAIKKSVDEDRRAGRFLLTGSADLLTLPQVADSLAGRMEIVTLLPLSQAEIHRASGGFLDDAFRGQVRSPSARGRPTDLMDRVLTGGYPEMLRRADPRRRQSWARNYLQAIVQRDAADIADLEKLDQLPRLLRILTQYAGQLVNFSQLGGQLGLDAKTARKYLGVLEQLFLIRRLEPWSRNQLSRLIKTPKLYFLDSGLLAALGGMSAERLSQDRTRFGPLLETFVISELLRQISWRDEPLYTYFYRDKGQNEVDLLLENDLGELIALEVKAAATVTMKDFRGLQKLASVAGDDFKLGMVVYDGEHVVPFAERLFAIPVTSLWA